MRKDSKKISELEWGVSRVFLRDGKQGIPIQIRCGSKEKFWQHLQSSEIAHDVGSISKSGCVNIVNIGTVSKFEQNNLRLKWGFLFYVMVYLFIVTKPLFLKVALRNVLKGDWRLVPNEGKNVKLWYKYEPNLILIVHSRGLWRTPVFQKVASLPHNISICNTNDVGLLLSYVYLSSSSSSEKRSPLPQLGSR